MEERQKPRALSGLIDSALGPCRTLEQSPPPAATARYRPIGGWRSVRRLPIHPSDGLQPLRLLHLLHLLLSTPGSSRSTHSDFTSLHRPTNCGRYGSSAPPRLAAHAVRPPSDITGPHANVPGRSTLQRRVEPDRPAQAVINGDTATTPGTALTRCSLPRWSRDGGWAPPTALGTLAALSSPGSLSRGRR